ncbi:MAG: hypothetical protein C5B53_00565 [Candidatus Melainabacteria bacterium]|nr:MAG: hypothetical protein C5B53_00565 [Candidatus Melainabacteria bacterium]
MSLAQWSLITLFIVIVADCGLLIVRKRYDLDLLRNYNEVTDPLLAVVGTLFAILLGFMVANAMTRFEEARNNAQMEAGAVGDIFRLAGAADDCNTVNLRRQCLQYVEDVANVEWKMMERHKMIDTAWNVYGDMWQEILHCEPKTQGQSNIHQSLLAAITQLGECRRARAAQLSYALPTSLWVIVCVGAIATIFFTYFFGAEKLPIQLTMTSIVATVLSLNIFLLISFDDPFSGDVRISSAPFDVDVKIFRSVLAHDWH